MNKRRLEDIEDVYYCRKNHNYEPIDIFYSASDADYSFYNPTKKYKIESQYKRDTIKEIFSVLTASCSDKYYIDLKVKEDEKSCFDDIQRFFRSRGWIIEVVHKKKDEFGTDYFNLVFYNK
ncbi:hypothetical protein EON71_00410 [bacterium]|nr:MAG: hypothetical protein EON71_00410 [bacterium]